MALRLALAPTPVLLALVSAAPLAGANDPGTVEPYGFADGQLRLAASKRVDSVVYSGSLAGRRAVKLGVISPGHARTVRFVVTFSAASPDDLQGLRTSTDFTWTAVQAT